MMYCQNCGKELRENAKFCDRCGASISPSQSKSIPVSNVEIEKDSEPDYSRFEPAFKQANIFHILFLSATTLLIILSIFLPVFKADIPILELDIDDLDDVTVAPEFLTTGKVSLSFSIFDDMKQFYKKFNSKPDIVTSYENEYGGTTTITEKDPGSSSEKLVYMVMFTIMLLSAGYVGMYIKKAIAFIVAINSREQMTKKIMIIKNMNQPQKIKQVPGWAAILFLFPLILAGAGLGSMLTSDSDVPTLARSRFENFSGITAGIIPIILLLGACVYFYAMKIVKDKAFTANVLSEHRAYPQE